MKQKPKRGQRHNALKHGAFAAELIIFDEIGEDFDKLHEGCVNELKPNGRMEEELVLTIAKYLWRKRRIERLFADEVKWNKTLAAEVDLVKSFNVDRFIREGMRCRDVWKIVTAHMPEYYVAQIRERYNIPSTEFDDGWIKSLKNFIEYIQTLDVYAIDGARFNSEYRGVTAAKIRELTNKQLLLEERFDLMIDKALKRLAILKTFKEVMVVKEAEQPRKISAK
jgi:uncharacterized protein YeeX (DUF496 family)